MSSGPGNIIIRVGAETAQAVRDLGNVNGALGETMTTSQKATAGIKKAALPAAAALGAIGFAAIDATKAALEDAAAADKLAHQLKRTTGATDDQISSVEDYISKTSLATGVTDDELRPALGKLATATGSVQKAQDELALALDISAQTGKSLDTVTTALAKGHSGQTAALGKLVPGLDKATLATKDMGKITAELADITAGAASESANTAAGKMKVWQIQMQELKETLGASLIPVVQQLGAILQKVTGFAAEHTTAIKVLVGVVAGLSAAVLITNAALKAYEAIQVAVKAATVAWTGVQWLLNAALDANPIGLVVIAVGALGAALVLAYKKSETFREIVDGALAGVKGTVEALERAFNQLRNAAFLAWDWIADHWKLALFAFGPIGAAIYEIAQHFDQIKAAAQGAWGWITENFGSGIGKVSAGVIAGIDAVTRAFRRVAGAVEAVVGAIESIIAAVERLIGWIGRIHFPHVPDLNPFNNRSASPSSSSTGPSARAGSASAGGTTINVYGALDPEGTARTIQRILTQHQRRLGLAP